jgi:hypothetical protein
MTITDEDVGTLGDGTGKRRIFTHDQLKKRCNRFLTKITVNHSPKELADFLFEALHTINSKGNIDRVDVELENCYKKWLENKEKNS